MKTPPIRSHEICSLCRVTSNLTRHVFHCAAVALYVAHYNLCRVHEALRVTPAMQLGVTDHIWTIGELLTATLGGGLPEMAGRKARRFTVIDGGKR